MSYEYVFKIITLGDAAVGKTATITRIVKGFFSRDYTSTIGVEHFGHIVEIDNKIVKLQIWDFLGQERFRLLLPLCFSGTRGTLLLFDLTRRGTFETLSDWMDATKENAGDIPMLLVGNKCDLEELREVSTEEAMNFAKSRNLIGYLETSAKTGENVGEAFKALSIVMLKNAGRSYEGTVKKKKKDTESEFVKDIGTKLDKLDIVISEEFSKEQIELINLKVEEIVTRTPKEGEFRFLIFGDENSQKPLLIKLLRVEQISWPPKTHSILYNTLDYTMKIDFHEYKFQLYFLSNLQRLKENSKLFNEAWKKSNGVVIFYNPSESEGFTRAADMGKLLRDNDPEIEIVLTSGSDNPTSLFHELERLEEDYQIDNSDDYNSLISELLINTLKRKKKINKEIKYAKSKLKEFQEQLNDQKARRELMEFIHSMENSQKMREIKTEKTVSLESAKLSPKNMIFISYSHKDSKWLERVQTHLKPLKREGNISPWDDTLIKPGEEWRKKIRQSLKSSKVAILLISPNFLASDFIANNELPPLLEGAKTQGTTILSLIISPSRFEKIESLAQLQTINNPESEPLVKLSEGEQDEVLVRLSNAVEDAFK